jgi:serine/threonine protein kinase
MFSSLQSHQPWLTNPYVSPEQRHTDDSADSLATAVAAPLTAAVKVDVWKAGIILWTLLTGCEPDTSAWDGKIPEDELQACPADAADLLQQMLQSDPCQRVDFEGIKQHAWFVHRLPPGALQLTEQFVHAEPVCCCSRAQVEEIVQEALDVVGCEDYGDSDSDDTVC